MGWSKKYKRSIDCNNPKGFSQKAHCAGRKKRENVMSSKLEELVGKPITEEQFDEAAGKKDACYHKVKARYDVWPSAYASGALVKCRKVGAANWGKSKKEGVNEMDSPMFKITYKDSRGAKKTDIMRAKNSNLAKRDFNALHRGRGFKILKVVKESVNERMDKRQAGEMLKQLGGNKFIAMTGAKNFAVGPKGASFKIGRNSKNVNYVRIDLKNDLYDMEFIQMRAGKMKVKSKVKQIYADQLQQMFTKHTGMYTSL